MLHQALLESCTGSIAHNNMQGSGSWHAVSRNMRRARCATQTIPGFLTQFRGEVDMNEAAEPLESFKTFNEFFYRKLKPSARPIANPEHPDVLVSSADCRLMAYASVDDATRCWIKARCMRLGDDPPAEQTVSVAPHLGAQFELGECSRASGHYKG